ncbi:hypothetical protein OESDEN_02738 [Oesophagostomum dentatum]|uniref:SCP domain-containing protein n=1 Tax=Oesophagostomum dentatum TaxID=61180 RepID=A0A0B1TIA7_OESDE|nr:hypothetical protein OESDEN_02738 [Oesophagostomum dentatum]
MASELTTQVGCGIVHCGELINVVCHCNTTLVNGVKLYTFGLPCKKCPEGESSCINGLCPAE